VKHCLSEKDYDDVDSDKRHTEVDDDNKDETPFDQYAVAIKVLTNEATVTPPKEAWHDDADNEGNDNDGKKKVKTSSVRKWFRRLFGGCVRKNDS